KGRKPDQEQRHSDQRRHDEQQLRLQSPGAQPFDQPASGLGQVSHGVVKHPRAIDTMEQGDLIAVAEIVILAQQQVEQDASQQRENTHQKWQIETVPYGQAVVGRAFPEYGSDRAMEKWPYAQPGSNTDDQAEEHQELHGK